MNHDVVEVNSSDPPMLPSPFLYEKEPGYEAMCQLLLNKPHNGRLAALFLEVTHAEFVRRELECTIGFDGEEI